MIRRPCALEADPLSFLDRLFSWAVRLTRNSADAEELVYGTYCEAFAGPACVRRGTNLTVLLFTTLYARSRHVAPEVGDSQNPDPDALSQLAECPAPPPTQLGDEADLETALDRVPEVLGQGLWLRDVEQFSYGEIGAILGIPRAAVLSRISRARGLLSECLGGAISDRMPTEAATSGRPTPVLARDTSGGAAAVV